VRKADAVLLIVGKRYGFVPTIKNPEALSVTHLEFREALKTGKPVFAFILRDSTREENVIPVVEDMFKEGLAHHGISPGVDAAMRATTAAWAVFGAARRWFQTPNRIPAEEMAARIETMVNPVLFGASQ
jgi:hypothetical protein